MTRKIKQEAKILKSKISLFKNKIDVILLDLKPLKIKIGKKRAIKIILKHFMEIGVWLKKFSKVFTDYKNIPEGNFNQFKQSTWIPKCFNDFSIIKSGRYEKKGTFFKIMISFYVNSKDIF